MRNIIINAYEKLSINTNIVANENLSINTNNLNVKASQDTNQTSQDKKSLNGSVNFTMYGGGGGTASLGGGKQSFQSDSVVNNNSQLLANNVNIDVKNDAVFQGANIKAQESVVLQTEKGDINLNAIKKESGHNLYFSGGFDKSKDVEYQTSNIEANNIIMQSGNDINLQASKLKAKENINLNAKNDVNVQALNSLRYTDRQITTKGTFSKKTTRDMEYKESVNSSEFNAENIYINSGNNINLEAVNINARDEKIAYAQNSLNIYSKIYKEDELHHTKKSSFGGLLKDEEKKESKNLKIKSSELTANNMILDAKTINVEASKLKANSMEISADILNMISSKERLFESEFSIKSGVLTATIESKGKIEEIVIPSTIEVNDKLIFNQKDLTEQLETDNLIKTLSSQSDLSIEQINLVKQIVENEQWHDKTTTLSGMGALIVQAVVTYFTAGAGATLTAGISNAALQTATQAAVQTVIREATVQLATAVITGNEIDLDYKQIAKNAITDGLIGYSNVLLTESSYIKNALTDNLDIMDYTTNAVIKGTFEGIRSESRGRDFKDGFTTGAVISVVSDGALQMRKYVKDNYDYVGNNELSEGIKGDGAKVGGSHPEKIYENGELKPNPVVAITGGSQMAEGKLFGYTYSEDGFINSAVEHYAGPHDFMSSWNYENIDGVTYLKDNGALVNTASGLLLIPATPFALAPFIEDNMNMIQDNRYFYNDNKDKRENAVNNAKDKK